MSERFADAQVGDEVSCELLGDGIIVEIHKNTAYQLYIKLLSGREASYDISGKYYNFFLKATLFYRQGEKRNLTERPKRKVKKVIEGWMVLRKDKLLVHPCIAVTSNLYATYQEARTALPSNSLLGAPIFISYEYEVEE